MMACAEPAVAVTPTRPSATINVTKKRIVSPHDIGCPDGPDSGVDVNKSDGAMRNAIPRIRPDSPDAVVEVSPNEPARDIESRAGCL